MHYRDQAHSFNSRILHHDRSTGPEIPFLEIGALVAVGLLKIDKTRQVRRLRVALTTAEKPKGVNFWTGDQSCVMWVSPPTGSWMTIDEELPERVRGR
jgi:hypothetical protein